MSVKPNGNLLVRSYAGVHPDTGKGRNISVTLPRGSDERTIQTACAELDARAAVIRGHASTMTVGAALSWWESTLRDREMSPTTISSYSSYLRRHVIPRVGSVYYDRADAALFADLYRDLRDDGDDGGNLSSSTVSKIHSMLSGAFRTLVGEHKASFNPIAELKQPKGETEEARALSPDDYATLAGHLGDVLSSPVADEEGYEALMMATLVWDDLHTGLRRGELAGAQERHWCSIAGTRGIRVARVLVYDADAPGGVREKDPKSKASRRFVTTDPLTTSRTDAYRAVRDAVLAESRVPVTADTPLFCHSDGSALRPAEITRGFRAMCDELGIERWVHLHTLRHTHASYLLDHGANLVEIQRRFGHESSKTTGDIYSHMLPGSDERLAAAAAEVTSGLVETAADAVCAAYVPTCPVSGEPCCRYLEATA